MMSMEVLVVFEEICSKKISLNRPANKILLSRDFLDTKSKEFDRVSPNDEERTM